MADVYILYSSSRNIFYIGSSLNAHLRLHEHNRGMTPSTKAGRPWNLVFTHETFSLPEARRLEYKIKQWKNRRLIEEIVRTQSLRIG